MTPPASPIAAAAPDDAHAAPRRRRRDRRRHPLLGSWRYAFGGRRKAVRRDGDAGHAAILDWYPADLLLAGLGVLALSVCDAALTLELIVRGHAEEANPAMALVLLGGDRLFVGVKMLVTCVGVIALVTFSSMPIGGRLPLRRVLYWLLAAYLLLVTYEVTMVLAFGP